MSIFLILIFIVSVCLIVMCPLMTDDLDWEETLYLLLFALFVIFAIYGLELLIDRRT